MTEAEDLLLEHLIDVVNQACGTVTYDRETILDSMAISAYADAMRVLAKYERLTIDEEYGRRVIGHWTDQESVVVVPGG